MKRTLLIDADIVAYKFACNNETVVYWDGKDQPPAVECNLECAVVEADAYLRDLKAHLSADDLIICLTDRGNEFRRDLWPDYKGNRKGVRKPELLFKLLDHFAAAHKSYLRPRLEADDCMGILSTHPTLVPGEKIIVSEDKDMQTIPGLLFNPRKDEKPRKIGRLAADRFHLWQTIVGDATDNYPGAKGIGEKSEEAKAVLSAKSVEEGWHHVLAAFERALRRKSNECSTCKGRGRQPPFTTCVTCDGYGSSLPPQEAAAQAVVQARCARILRASDWNFREKRPVLWSPPRLK